MNRTDAARHVSSSLVGNRCCCCLDGHHRGRCPQMGGRTRARLPRWALIRPSARSGAIARCAVPAATVRWAASWTTGPSGRHRWPFGGRSEQRCGILPGTPHSRPARTAGFRRAGVRTPGPPSWPLAGRRPGRAWSAAGGPAGRRRWRPAGRVAPGHRRNHDRNTIAKACTAHSAALAQVVPVLHRLGGLAASVRLFRRGSVGRRGRSIRRRHLAR